ADLKHQQACRSTRSISISPPHTVHWGALRYGWSVQYYSFTNRPHANVRRGSISGVVVTGLHTSVGMCSRHEANMSAIRAEDWLVCSGIRPSVTPAAP